MPRNVEIKARVRDMALLQARATKVAGAGPTEIHQDDTFFRCDQGRLKLRCFSADDGELIFYRRPDQAGPKTSFYIRTPTNEPRSLREALGHAYGEIGRVVKRRQLYVRGRTRIHLDEVEGLGNFMELEVVLSENEAEDEGVKVAHSLMRELGVSPEDLVESAYFDLLSETAR